MRSSSLVSFFASAIACLTLSTIYHTCCCHSEKTGKFFQKLDYTGIVFLTTGSFIPSLYYGFYCNPTERFIYMTIATVIGTTCFVICLFDKFGTSEYRGFRAGMFSIFGLSGVLPGVHYVFMEGADKALYRVGDLTWLILMAAFYLLGALIYAKRIPERLFPGKCDLLFQSHQIMHLLVIAGAYTAYRRLTSLPEEIKKLGGCRL